MPGGALDLRQNEGRILSDDGVDGKGAKDRGEDHAADERAVQVLHDFLEHEGDRGQRGIKSGGEPGGSAGRSRAATTLFRNAERPAQLGGDTPGDENRRPFPAQAQAAADMEETGEEFHQHSPQPNESEILPERELELRDAAPGRARVDPRHEPASA